MDSGIGLDRQWRDKTGQVQSAGFYVAHLRNWEQAFVFHLLWFWAGKMEFCLLDVIWRGDWPDNRTLSIYLLPQLVSVSISNWSIDVCLWDCRLDFGFRFSDRRFYWLAA